MRRKSAFPVALFGPLLGLFFGLVSGPLSLTGQENLIPRRIAFEATSDIPPITVEILYAKLAALQPVVVAGSGEQPHNVITVETGDDSVNFVLRDADNRTISVVPTARDDLESNEGIETACTDVAVSWAPLLGLVEPVVREDVQRERDRLEAEVSLEERLATPFQTTLWIPAAIRLVLLSGDSGGAVDPIWLWPLSAEFHWFPQESFGLTASFRFEYGDHISFASDSGNPVNTDALILLPGVGVLFRTLGRFSAEFGIKVSFGAVRFTIDADSTVPPGLAGDTFWGFYPVFSIEPNLVWNFSDRWSLKARIMGMDLNLIGIAGDDSTRPYSADTNTIILTLLQLGFSYRW